MSSSPTRRSQDRQDGEMDTSSDLAMMQPTSPVNQGAAMLATSDPVAPPHTPANISEIDLSSPLFYGTPSSSARTPGGSALTPGRTPRGAQTPVSTNFLILEIRPFNFSPIIQTLIFFYFMMKIKQA